MKGNWLKIVYERNIYVVDLDCISTFVCAENGRLIFWLPDGKLQIVIHPKSNPQVYQQILNYVEKIAEQSPWRVSRARLDGLSPDRGTNCDLSPQGSSEEIRATEPELDARAKY
jgi:hypothetical protein